jgi:hypothetical protein
MRLFVRGGRIIALTGLEGMPAGDPGGELAIALCLTSVVATKCGVVGQPDCSRCCRWWNADPEVAVGV